MKKKSTPYDFEPGKNARCVAEWAAAGKMDRASKRAPEAVADAQLFHPELWSQWKMASDQVFESMAEAMDPKELPLLADAVDRSGFGVVEYFASEPTKLKALAKAGIDLGRQGSTVLMGRRVSPALAQAARGNLSGILGLAQAGAEAPEAMGEELGDAMGEAVSVAGQKARPRTALHVFALSWRAEETLQLWNVVCDQTMNSKEDAFLAEKRIALLWLGSKTGLGVRAPSGMDALGLAIDAGNAGIAKILLGMGLDPTRKDGKGRDCMDLLERRVRALAVEGDELRARRLKALVPVLRSAIESREIEQSSGLGTQVRPAKSRL